MVTESFKKLGTKTESIITNGMLSKPVLLSCLTNAKGIGLNDTRPTKKVITTRLGGCVARGFKHSEEFKEKRRQRMLGENNPMYGKTGSQNPAFGADHSGEKNGMYGRHHTEEANEKNRQAHFGRNNANSKPVICVETSQFFWSMGEAKRVTGCDDTTITRCCRGIKKTCGGYHWRYATKEEIESQNYIIT